MLLEEIPSHGTLKIKNLILDLNGTLTIDGKIIEGVTSRLKHLREIMPNIYLFTGDTHGNAKEISEKLGLELRLTKSGESKLEEALKIGVESTAAIGNGLIDSRLLDQVGLGIVVLQEEGAHPKAILSADIIVKSINDALDLMLYPKRLIATLRP